MPASSRVKRPRFHWAKKPLTPSNRRVSSGSVYLAETCTICGTTQVIMPATTSKETPSTTAG